MEPITAKYIVWQATLFGASAIAFGLGVLFAGSIKADLAWLIIIFGVCIHGWGMYHMYKRKNR